MELCKISATGVYLANMIILIGPFLGVDEFCLRLIVVRFCDKVIWGVVNQLKRDKQWET